MVESKHDRFYDDHGPINDQSEVECPEAHEVSGNAHGIHHPDGEEHGKRDHRGYDEPCAEVTQEEYQDENDDQCTFHEVRFHGTDGSIDHFCAVKE